MDIAVKKLMTPLPHAVGAQVSVKKAYEMMDKYECRHLPVLDDHELVGVVSMHDLKTVQKFGNQELSVFDVMSDEPVVVEPTDLVGKVIETMLDKKINSVVVHGKADEPWGIFTSTDAMKHLMRLMGR